MRNAHPSGDTPRFDILTSPPDITPWLDGDGAIPAVTTRDSGRPGPHVALLSLMHGNEFAGAIVLDRMLRAGLMPARGRISFAFVNTAAFDRFDLRNPTMSRFIDEDINRVWDPEVLDGPRQSIELNRARELRPLIDQADVVLDLHSMLWASDPLILSGPSPRGQALARAIGTPDLVVADGGHANGPRMIDYIAAQRPDASAVLVEAGQHWMPETIDIAAAAVAGLLRHLAMIGDHPALPPPPPAAPVRFAQVTDLITARTSTFCFTRTWAGGDVVPERDTLIAMDGGTEIRTPYDDCLLIMPSLRPGRGHTAVRLARFVG
jgi:predicted deacylase